MPQQAEIETLLERFFQAFNNYDLEGMMRCFAEDATFDSPLGEPDGRRLAGHESIRAYYRHFLNDLGDIRFEDLTHWGEGERGVAEWTLHATTQHGTVMTLRGCDLFIFRDGQIAHKDTFLKQLR